MTSGTRSRHQPMASWPRRTTGSSAVSPSHHGASMPPAYQEQAARPKPSARSMTSTLQPRSASSVATVRPATPAPTTVTFMTWLLRRLDSFVDRHVKIATFAIFQCHRLHAFLLRLGTNVVTDAHGAEFRPAHGTEMRDLVRFLRQGLVMEIPRRFRVEREVELIFPAELEAARDSASSRICAAGWPLARSAACAASL